MPKPKASELAEIRAARRNSHPHKEAVAAMHLWPHEYAKQSGGSMDFYDALPDEKKDFCRLTVDAILKAEGRDA